MAVKDADLNGDGTITKREMNSYNAKNDKPITNEQRKIYNQRSGDKAKQDGSPNEWTGVQPGTLGTTDPQIILSGWGAGTTTGSDPWNNFGDFGETEYGDLSINQVSKLKYLFVALREDNDPRLKAWYKQAGFKNWDDAKVAWDKAADYAYKLAQGRAASGSSESVNFFEIMGSKQFRKSLSGGGSGGGAAGPMVYTTLTDPATARQDLVKMMKSVAGRPPTDAEVKEYIKKLTSAQNKAKTTVFQGKTVQSRFDEEEFLMNFVVGKTDFTGTLKTGMARQSLNTVDMTINAYGIGSYVTADKRNKFAKQLLTGELTPEELGQKLSAIAAKAFPAFAETINSNPGVSLRELFDDYVGTYANMLELDFDTVDIKDVLAKATKTSADGKYETLSLFDLEKALRNDPRFGYTKRAHQEAASYGSAVARSMGVNL